MEFNVETLLTVNSCRMRLDQIEEMRKALQSDLNKMTDKMENFDDMEVTEQERLSASVSSVRNQKDELEKQKIDVQMRMDDLQKAKEQFENNVRNHDNFLASEEAEKRFAEILIESRSSEMAMTKWENELNQRGVAWSGGAPLPTSVSRAIEDNIGKIGAIYSLVTKSWGVNEQIFINETGGQLGYGDNRTDKNTAKTEQTLNFGKVTITTQFLYKFIELDREDIVTVDGVLEYVKKELPERLVKTIEKAIMITTGSGTETTAIKSFQPICGMSAPHTTEITADVIDAETLDEMWLTIDEPGQVYLIGSKTDYVRLKQVKNQLGVPVYESGSTNIAGNTYKTIGGFPYIDVDYIVPLEDATVGSYSLTMAVLSGYTIIGQQSMSFYSETDNKRNKELYMVEQRLGGAPVKLKMAATLKKGTPTVLTATAGKTK